MLVTITINSNGTVRFWNENDKLHRIGGPAFEHASGGKSWIVNGKRHRLDGPAVEYPDGTKFWWINDKQYTEEEFNEIVGEIC